jgi:hypothetical protein
MFGFQRAHAEQEGQKTYQELRKDFPGAMNEMTKWEE